MQYLDPTIFKMEILAWNRSELFIFADQKNGEGFRNELSHVKRVLTAKEQPKSGEPASMQS